MCGCAEGPPGPRRDLWGLVAQDAGLGGGSGRLLFHWDFNVGGSSHGDVDVLVRCGIDRDVVGVDFVSEVVDEPDANRSSGSAGSTKHAGAVFAGQMLVAPIRQCSNDNV